MRGSTVAKLTSVEPSHVESCLLDLHAVPPGPDFIPGVMAVLRRLIGAPWALFGVSHPKTGSFSHGVRSPEQLDVERWVPVFLATFWDHPLNSHASRIAAGQPVMMHDIVGPAWQNSANFNEFQKPNGIEHQLMIRLPSEREVVSAIGVARDGRPFSERDREMFQRITQHLLMAHRRARVLEACNASLGSELDGWRTHLVVVDREGQARYLTESAARLLRSCFPRWRGLGSGRSSLPTVLRDWIRQQCRLLPRVPPDRLVVDVNLDGERHTLAASLYVQPDTGRYEIYLETRRREPDLLALANISARVRDEEELLARATARWCLTPRQRQVLSLLARGLANKEIARDLNCAEVTVEFHVTGLLKRCGADNRTVLAARFWNDGR